MSEANTLNKKFGVAGQATFREAAGGLIMLDIKNNAASATIVLQGAHMTDWTPKGAKPVIWLSPDAKFAPGKSIRGGVPVCWPWFGPHESVKEYPAHGYARTVPWDVQSLIVTADVTRVVLRLRQDDKTRGMWPHECELDMEYVIGKTLDINLLTRNTGSKEFVIGQALHTYFNVGDVTKVHIKGLDACPYLDKVDGMKSKKQSGDVTIGSEVDRIYLESKADCLIDDAALNRRIRIAKRNSASTIVWNPWVEKAQQMGDLGKDGHLHMLCVESANASSDVVKVAAGGSCCLQVTYSVEAL
jgi:glucose-6-phosphate 1-epimerase